MDKNLVDSSNMEFKNGKTLLNGNHKITNGQQILGQQDSLCALECPSQHYEDDPRDYSCGFWFFRPKLLQRLANKKAFLAVFCLTSVLQGMYFTYFVSVLTTIEKLYQIQSKTTGIIMSATEIGQIGGALLLTYYGGQGHRPKWIACGMLVFALASILCSMPHFLFGGDIRSMHENSTLPKNAPHLCHLPPVSVPGNLTFNNETVKPTQEKTKCDFPEETIQQTRITNSVLTVFFISLLFIGIGATAVYTLGIPYIDDNVATRESPLYFGITIGVKILGPVFGFLLGSFCTSVYVNFPFAEDSGLSPSDPQWIGAWWLGVFIVGTTLFIATLPMMSFPRKLPKSDHSLRKSIGACQHALALNSGSKPTKKQSKTPSLKHFPGAMCRLLRNDVLLCRTASSVLHILPIAGLYTFLPKYLESQFQLTAAKANMISGVAGILVMGIGIFASGTFMRKFKPNATFVARWISAAALIYSLGMVILMWLGCPLNHFIGLNSDSQLTTTAHCSANCGCNVGEFAPVCADDVTYLSPCLAGCQKVNKLYDEQDIYLDCQCLPDNSTAVAGFCPLPCNNLAWYIIVFSFFVLVHSTSEVGSMMLTLRCVEPKDKAMALGLISVAIGLFGNVPCPIIYGAVVDSACLFWEDNCGEAGACRVYDPEKFRMVFHGLTAAIMFAAFLVDTLVCFKARSIQLQDEEHVTNAEEVIPMNSQPCSQFESSV